MSTLTMAKLQAAYKVLEALPSVPAQKPIIESPYLGKWEQYRFPRSKKRRMQKKWRKDRRNHRWIEDTTIYETPSMIICSPLVANRLRRELISTFPDCISHCDPNRRDDSNHPLNRLARGEKVS